MQLAAQAVLLSTASGHWTLRVCLDTRRGLAGLLRERMREITPRTSFSRRDGVGVTPWSLSHIKIVKAPTRHYVRVTRHPMDISHPTAPHLLHTPHPPHLVYLTLHTHFTQHNPHPPHPTPTNSTSLHTPQASQLNTARLQHTSRQREPATWVGSYIVDTTHRSCCTTKHTLSDTATASQHSVLTTHSREDRVGYSPRSKSAFIFITSSVCPPIRYRPSTLSPG